VPLNTRQDLLKSPPFQKHRDPSEDRGLLCQLTWNFRIRDHQTRVGIRKGTPTLTDGRRGFVRGEIGQVAQPYRVNKLCGKVFGSRHGRRI